MIHYKIYTIRYGSNNIKYVIAAFYRGTLSTSNDTSTPTQPRPQITTYDNTETVAIREFLCNCLCGSVERCSCIINVLNTAINELQQNGESVCYEQI